MTVMNDRMMNSDREKRKKERFFIEKKAKRDRQDECDM
jgi:hypothetical protein